MSREQFESRLAGLQEESLPEVPELVHLRMEDTYRIIGGGDEAGLEETPAKSSALSPTENVAGDPGC